MKIMHLLALGASVFLGACASVGKQVQIPLTLPGGEEATIVAHEQSVPDWTLARKNLKFNFVVRGDVSEKQLVAIAEVERACRIYAGDTLPLVTFGYQTYFEKCGRDIFDLFPAYRMKILAR